MGACDIGVMGLAVMGQNLVLNMVDHGYRVAVFNRTTSKVDEFLAMDESRARAASLVGTHSLKELVASLKRPRRVMMMIQSKDAVPAPNLALYPDVAAIDAVIAELITLLEPGDIIIDGGNTHFRDTERRTKVVESHGLLYIGTGVSGGEEGARKGPSIMPGGTETGWQHVRPLFQDISAKVGARGDIPCCDWVGARGAGHYVKMVHNGIEYGDMQLICEAYWLLKQGCGCSNAMLRETFTEWNRGELDSYLIEITRDIFGVRDRETGTDLVDLIVDTAGAKGTGKWMSQLALDVGVPSTLVTEAVYARSLSSAKETRKKAATLLAGPTGKQYSGDVATFAREVHDALLASKICSYAQGFVQMAAAAKEYDWKLDPGSIAMLWRGGCIIRAVFLERIKEAFDQDPSLENLLFSPYFREITARAQGAWRHVIQVAIELGVPVPAFTTALAYYDGLRSERLPANLLQAQRDYFGAHTYQRTDRPGVFHTDWVSERSPVQ